MNSGTSPVRAQQCKVFTLWEDWEGIRMLHTSIKEEDPLKVGRFGLGFKSVFHLAGNAAMVCCCLGMEIHLLPKTLTGISDCLKCCKFKVKP
jgi:hypothetical protein